MRGALMGGHGRPDSERGLPKCPFHNEFIAICRIRLTHIACMTELWLECLAVLFGQLAPTANVAQQTYAL